MPSYRRPGVYFEEVVAPAEAVTSTSLSAGAFLAANPRGPVAAKHISSWTQYMTYFGGFFGINDFLPFALFEFFANGGREAYVARVPGSGATAATKTLLNQVTGSTDEVQTITITGTPTGGTFTLSYGGQTTAPIAYNAAAGAVDTALEALSSIGAGNVAVTGGPGPGTPYVVTFGGALAATDVALITATSSLTGGTTPAIAVVETTKGVGPANTIRIDANNPGAWGNSIYIDVVDVGTDRFSLAVKLGGPSDAYTVERWLDLSLDPADSRYAPALVNASVGGSPYIVVTDLTPTTVAATDRPLAQTNTALAGGLDGGTVAAGDLGTALAVFDSIEVPLTLNLPGHTGAAIGTALGYAAGRGDVFVVIDTPQGNDPATAVTFGSGLGASSFGAVYYPWIQVADPASSAPGAMRVLPPGGAVIGQYASTDATRGVFKTPAGIGNRISGAVGVERKLTGTDLDNLNMANVNAIRHLPGAGVVIMGGRTLKLSGSDKYVAVRRTLIFIRSSLIRSTRFAIFEPNDERLWLVLRSMIERFLLDFWQSGGLRGGTADEAFFVKCDEELNSPQSISAGEVKVQIGVALQYPAEYVVFTLSQREVGATVTVEA